MAPGDEHMFESEIKRNTEETKLLQAEIFERLARSEAENGAKFDKIFAVLDILIDQTPSKHHHGAGLNNNRLPFQMMQRTHPFMSWIELTRALELDFGPSIYECPRATLFKLNQTGYVADYYLKFTSLANCVYGLSNDALVDCFVSGLSNEIRRDVLIHTPPSLVKAVSLAKVYEEKYASNLKSQKSNHTNYSTNQPFTNKPETITRNSAPILNTPPTRPMSQFQKNPNIKRISPAERQVRRDKGLCYWCDDKFSYTHKCPNRQLMLLQYDDNEEENVVEIPSDSSDVAINTLETTQPEHHLSFNAMKGNSSMGILRFSGTIKHIQVQILIDGGSSDNFLQPRIARFLKLPIEPGPVFKVLVGNGEIMTAEGVIQNLALNIQGTELQVPVFLLPVAGADVILGASWLATLGPHVADYASLTVKFFINGKFVTLQGEATPRPAAAQFNHFKRLHYTDAIAECFTIQWLKSHTDEDIFRDLPTNIEPEIAILLHTYKELFKTPNTLPPHRSHNHSIPLIEGHNPVKVKPYRYPHSQKNQIELMVQDMLQQGIIQPSTSPFSSPIVLVKKKDGTWRFCTDYRALNAITVKDSFPIPTVDELLDELFGANFFSKLDLRSGYHQILLQPEDRYKTAFRTHQGLYEWLVMPFGLTNAPTTFQGSSLAMSSAYHPQSDGQTEVLNKGLELFLRCFTFNNPKSWYKALAWSEFWYNTTLHTSIGMTPFKALYGREPPTLTRYEAQDSDPPALQEELKERDKILQQLKSNLERAQQYMKKQADKHRIEVKFQLGDLVLVKLQPYRQQSVALRKNHKLEMRYFGPFEIIACVGKVAYKLKLPDHAKIHPGFHVSQLKPFKGVPQQQYKPLPLTMSDNGPMIQPVEILQVRTIMKGTQRIHQVLVQWDQYDIAEATWEDIDDLQKNFPLYNLEDKVVFKGDGIVMRPKEEDILEAYNSAKTPHNMQEGKVVSNDAQMMGPRRSGRSRNEHSMWKNYTK
ncbi:unnamed protein product [Trifolium pratense]|uniref:Uncharacterized protein n=1 Tax=Trifolium pratense TaxID=57577 RepID=A0ACB0JJA7_TRIPR|nr:unnamed protein product [Trifolium pratense]